MSKEDCALCHENVAKYVCPRCNLPYCSLVCYQLPIHSKCSEAFYKECVENEMKISEHDPEAKRKMVEILKKNSELDLDQFDGSDSDDELDLAERLRGVDLNDPAQVWERLTTEERTEFLDLTKTGDVSKLIPSWEPWWIKNRRVKVLPLGASGPTDIELPSLKTDIPLLSDLSSSKASPLVFNNLVNVLAAYALMCRFFNGEHILSPDESCCVLLKISTNLSANQIFETIESAITSVSQESINYEVIGASEENISLMTNDVSKILLGPSDLSPSYYVLLALSDVHSLLNKSKSSEKNRVVKQSLSSNLPPVFYENIQNSYSKKQINLAIKKIEYYLSWVNCSYSDILGHLKDIFPENDE